MRPDPFPPSTWGYDAGSQQRFRIDGRGNRTTYVHDDAGRLTGRRYPDGSRVTFAFDAVGARTKMHDANGRTTYTFDDLGRLRTVVNPANKNLTYSYDAIGQRRCLIEPGGGRFTTAYDDAGRIRFLVNPQGYRTTWSYDVADRVKVQYLGNSTRASYSYDDANRVLRLANIRSDATTISSFDNAYDAVSNRTRVIESDGIRVTWSYDNAYQLVRERRNGANAYDITYSYDAAGNRRTKLEDSIRTTYAYDMANQLRYHEDNTGRTTYTFDRNGNQQIVRTSSGSLTTSTWHYDNELTRVQLPSGTRNTFSYDADGKRVTKQDSSVTSKYVWDEENILIETNALDITQAVFTLEPITYGNLLSQYRSAQTSFYHFDGLGSTDRLTNSIGVITDSNIYKGFGIILATSGVTTNSFRFVGRLGYFLDSELSLYFLRRRSYDAALARFTSCDPAAAFHFYPYVYNRPTFEVDPSGLIAITATKIEDSKCGAFGCHYSFSGVRNSFLLQYVCWTETTAECFTPLDGCCKPLRWITRSCCFYEWISDPNKGDTHSSPTRQICPCAWNGLITVKARIRRYHAYGPWLDDLRRWRRYKTIPWCSWLGKVGTFPISATPPKWWDRGFGWAGHTDTRVEWQCCFDDPTICWQKVMCLSCPRPGLTGVGHCIAS